MASQGRDHSSNIIEMYLRASLAEPSFEHPFRALITKVPSCKKLRATSSNPILAELLHGSIPDFVEFVPASTRRAAEQSSSSERSGDTTTPATTPTTVTTTPEDTGNMFGGFISEDDAAEWAAFFLGWNLAISVGLSLCPTTPEFIPGSTLSSTAPVFVPRWSNLSAEAAEFRPAAKGH